VSVCELIRYSDVDVLWHVGTIPTIILISINIWLLSLGVLMQSHVMLLNT